MTELPSEPSEEPAEGVVPVPGAAEEIDITDAALASGTPAGADGSSDRADDAAVASAPATADAPADGDDVTPADPPAPGLPAPPGTAAGAASGRPRDAYRPPTTAADALDGAQGDEAPPPLRTVLEAILLVVDEPVPEVNLAQVLEVPRATVLAELEGLAAAYAADDRGFELRQVGGGWRLYTAPACAAYVERFVLDGQQARLTQAALETLAVIAYRQPVTRQSVAAIRGVNVDGVIRTLVSRGLVAEAGEDGPGGAHLYVTTPYFLERLGLRSLDDLPNLAPLLPANIDDLADQA